MKLNYRFKIVFFLTFFIIIYCNAQAPAIEWQKNFGGSASENGYSIIQTQDGGYIVVGDTNSSNGDITGYHGNTDVWVVKLNSSGIIEWQKALGGTFVDKGNYIIQTQDGGYILVGETSSTNGDVTSNHGEYDVWVVKLNSSGSIEWQKTYGGTLMEQGQSIVQTQEGGYILVGSTSSTNGDVIGNHGEYDVWVVKLNSSGSIEWQKALGGTILDIGKGILQIQDGTYIVAGTVRSINGDVIGNHGGGDIWVVKLNSTGSLLWQKTYGGGTSDGLNSIYATTDGGYAITGGSNSLSGDVTQNQGGYDNWVIKLNSSGTIEWQRTIGGSQTDIGESITQAPDGGFVVVGYTFSNDGDIYGNQGIVDSWIVKLNSTGTIEWQKLLGGSSHDSSSSIVKTLNGSYIISGNSNSQDGDLTGNNGNSDVWVVKLYAENLLNPTFKDQIQITLSPNPTKEKITLKLDYFNPSQKVSISDIQGKIIHNQELESVSTTINTGSFEKGIYFLNLIDGTQKTTKKFIVE